MYPISGTMQTYLGERTRDWLVKVEIDQIEYGDDEIVDFGITRSLISSDEFEVGTAISSILTLKMKTDVEVPPNAEIIPYVSLTGDQGDAEWVPLGEFYVDVREQVDNLWVYKCMDKLVTADVPYISTINYPATMQDVWDEICNSLGFSSDVSVQIDPGYTIEMGPTGFTKRQVLAYIAGAHGASVYVGRDGKINWTVFAMEDPVTAIELPMSERYRSAQLNPRKSYTRIVGVYDVDEGLAYEAGSGDENHTLYIENPFITQSIVNDLYTQLNGFYYQPAEIDARGLPQLEPGDVIQYGQSFDLTWEDADIAWDDADFSWDGWTGGGRTYALDISFSFRGGLFTTITAPSASEQESEFNVDGSITGAINRLNKDAVKLGKPYYGVIFTREDGFVVERGDHNSKVIFNSDVMSWQVNGQDRLYFDAVDGKLKYRGDIIMEGGTISWANVNSDPLAVDAYDAAGDAQDTADSALSTAQQIANGTYSGGTFISGSQIFSPSIFGGTIQIGSSNNVFKADSSGIWAGHSNFASAPFRVNMQGELTAMTGTFGGSLSSASGTFTGALQGGSITIGSGNNVFRADTLGIWAGNATYANAPFRVSMAGKLVAADADITGSITATSGTIGGWGIDSGYLFGGTLLGGTIRGGEIETAMAGNYPRIALSASGNELIFAASANNYFKIYQSGPIFQVDIVYGSSLFYISKGSSGTTIGATDYLNLSAPTVAVNGIPI